LWGCTTLKIGKPSGDTENLLAQKLPLLSRRLIEQLKYCESITSRLKYYVVNEISIVILSIKV